MPSKNVTYGSWRTHTEMEALLAAGLIVSSCKVEVSRRVLQENPLVLMREQRAKSRETALCVGHRSGLLAGKNR